MTKDLIQLAGCIIQNKHGHILLIHRTTPKHTQWEIPGGKVDDGEDPTHTAIRELREELGIGVRIITKLGEKDFAHGDRQMNYHWFSATITQGEPEILEPHIHDKWEYFSLDDLADMDDQLSANTRNFLAELKSARIRL